jgi:hypothetical protein
LAGPDIDDLERRSALAKTILDGVIDSSKHEDEKVGRILTSMSFLTVGAAIAFSTFVGNRIGLIAYGVDLVSVLFFAYLFLLVVGTIIMLEAMSPRLHLRPGKRAEDKDADASSASLESIYFFKSIARTDQAEWLARFKDTSEADLLVRQCDDALRQARFLSIKVTHKVEFIRKAKWIILLASSLLVAMVAAGVLSYLLD